ncbi:DUF6005 family protein [Balneatrix alpica]|uniref:DUF6005 family protein n=1 Tax=Balneatrix alpica TaxID=75684 RepID=UPI002739E161|nr:DUF6005 family protein [Balneatrix alpica]
MQQMSQAEIVHAIEQVLKVSMAYPHAQRFHPQARLNQDLYLDSVLLMQLLVHLELEWGLSVPDSALNKEQLATVQQLAQLLAAPQQPATEVVTEEYDDIKVHCVVSCLSAAVKAAAGDQRPFYFGLWDGDFAINEQGALNYHHASLNHQGYCRWFERLYGVEVKQWYEPALSQEQNLAKMEALLTARSPTESVMVMLDLYYLPERENKFNQNPFPHYVMLEQTEDPDTWLMLDPDFRWQGRLPRAQIRQAILQPSVAGGFHFDRANLRAPQVADIAAYFVEGFTWQQPLTEAMREVISGHWQGRWPLAQLGFALRELPVICVRKYAYEHGFAYFWRALGRDMAEFEQHCEQIEALVQAFKRLHYLAIKLAESPSEELYQQIHALLRQMLLQEQQIKTCLYQAYQAWCQQQQLDAHVAEVA